MQRRVFLASLTAMGGAVALNQAAALASQSNVKIEILSESDPRVKTLLSYIKLAKVNPVEALAKYADPQVTYASTAGQNFSKDELVKRLEEWNRGFEFKKLVFEWAIATPDGGIVASIVYDLVHYGQFRGSSATKAGGEVGRIFEVSFNKSGKIDHYESFAQYKALASFVKPSSQASLLGIN